MSSDTDSRLTVSKLEFENNERIRTMNLAISLKVLCFIQGLTVIDPGLQFNVFGGVYLGLIVANVIYALVGFASAAFFDITLVASYGVFITIKIFLNCWAIFFTSFFSLGALYLIFSLVQTLIGGLYLLITILLCVAIIRHGPPDNVAFLQENVNTARPRDSLLHGYDSNHESMLV